MALQITFSGEALHAPFTVGKGTIKNFLDLAMLFFLMASEIALGGESSNGFAVAGQADVRSVMLIHVISEELA